MMLRARDRRMWFKCLFQDYRVQRGGTKQITRADDWTRSRHYTKSQADHETTIPYCKIKMKALFPLKRVKKNKERRKKTVNQTRKEKKKKAQVLFTNSDEQWFSQGVWSRLYF